MLSHITTVDVAPERARFYTGATLLCDVSAVLPRHRASGAAAASSAAAGSAVASAAPQPRGGALIGTGAHVAEQAILAVKQPTSQQYANPMTRFAAIGGGAMGPHPAREPV